jgi:large subunit ribosomal protein L23
VIVDRQEIKEAIEKVFKVHVEDVRTMIVRGKEKRMGRFVGKRASWKKAIVTLKAGDTIDIFEAQ